VEAFFALSLSFSLQLTALSPMALAIPQIAPSSVAEEVVFSPLEVCSRCMVGGGEGGRTSSSQTLSTIPVEDECPEGTGRP